MWDIQSDSDQKWGFVSCFLIMENPSILLSNIVSIMVPFLFCLLVNVFSPEMAFIHNCAQPRGQHYVYASPPMVVDEDGWTRFNAFSYKAFNEKVSRHDASYACYKLGADLASIHSKSENNFVLGLMDQADPDGKNNFWIGLALTRLSYGYLAKCQWSDGTPFDFGQCQSGGNGPPHYPWAHLEPNNLAKEENCVNFEHNYGKNFVGWVDDVCDDIPARPEIRPRRFGYVCKKKW